MKLGVCYYPEQWPEEKWESDARGMAALGLSIVRIGEFAWSRIEPEPGVLAFDWLDRAISVLASAGLKIVLGTPTATPPKWLIDQHPDILPVGGDGRPRRFGSRRHYCFSSVTYRREAARIVSALAKRYGRHPALTAWQTDNEYGCHDTVVSYSPDAISAFRRWLAAQYKDIVALNEAWGNVFWSQEYRSFDEIDPPAETVTEANPAHRLDYRRFASDEVVSFNKLQADILRADSPGRDILHNFMGLFTQFDHHKVSSDLDVAAWDSYPLGFLELGPHARETKERFLRQGHPDFAAFHHDLYRGCGRGRMWVMEQQPGPVNWSRYNPAPLPGMVRTWIWETFAHGGEVSSIFRWRQAPFAQEQMHAAIRLPNDEEDVAAGEVRTVAEEIAQLSLGARPRLGDAALIFSYEADWLFEIQPQGQNFSYLRLVLEWYGALRRLGLDIDILPPGAPVDGYKLIVAPSLPILRDGTMRALRGADGVIVFGPRTGSKTEAFRIPSNLPPGPLQDLLPLRVTRVESLRPGMGEVVRSGNEEYSLHSWLEHVSTDLNPRALAAHDRGIWFEAGRVHYVAAWPSEALLERILTDAAEDAGLALRPLPEGLRLRRLGDVQFAFNYDSAATDLGRALSPAPARFLMGGPVIPPGGLSAWRV